MAAAAARHLDRLIRGNAHIAHRVELGSLLLLEGSKIARISSLLISWLSRSYSFHHRGPERPQRCAEKQAQGLSVCHLGCVRAGGPFSARLPVGEVA